MEQTDADDMRTRASLVETLVLRGKTEEAGKLADDLLAKEPKDPDVMLARGRWLVAHGARRRGRERCSPRPRPGHDADPLVELAAAWLAKGDAVRARAAAEAALARMPGQPWAQGVLGSCPRAAKAGATTASRP